MTAPTNGMEGTSPGPLLPMRGDKEAIEQRRHLVKEMVVRGMNHSAIAKTLGVHRNTVLNDVKEVRRQMRSAITNIDPIEEVAESVETLKMLGREAIMQYHNAEKPTTKNALLNTAKAIEESKMKILMLTGLVPSDVQSSLIEAELSADRTKKVESQFDREGIASVLKNPESRRRILSTMNKLLQVGGKEVLKMAKDQKKEESHATGQQVTTGPAGGEGNAQGGAVAGGGIAPKNGAADQKAGEPPGTAAVGGK